MKTPTRVTIDITAEGWTTSVFHEDELLTTRRMIMESAGLSRSDRKEDIYDDLPNNPCLAEGIDCSDPFDIAGELWRLREGESEDQ